MVYYYRTDCCQYRIIQCSPYRSRQGFQQAGAAVAGPTALQKTPVLGQMLLGLLPANLFDQAAHGKVAPIAIFAIIFAIALSVCGKEAVVVKDFFERLAKVLLKITHWIIQLAPLGIFAFIASVIAHFGLASLLPFGKFILTVCFACVLQLGVYAVLLFAVARVNPLDFACKAWPMLVTAFTTSSSLATLPLTMEVLTQRMGVPEKPHPLSLHWELMRKWMRVAPSIQLSFVFLLLHCFIFRLIGINIYY